MLPVVVRKGNRSVWRRWRCGSLIPIELRICPLLTLPREAAEGIFAGEDREGMDCGFVRLPPENQRDTNTSVEAGLRVKLRRCALNGVNTAIFLILLFYLLISGCGDRQRARRLHRGDEDCLTHLERELTWDAGEADKTRSHRRRMETPPVLLPFALP